MKKRITTYLLAATLAAGVFAGPVMAEEAATEAAVAQVESEIAADDGVAVAETEGAAAAEKQPASVTGDGKYAAYYPSMEQSIEQSLLQLSQMTDEQMEQYKQSNDSSVSILFNTWDQVREELGAFESVDSYTVDESDNIITFDLATNYSDVVEGSKVTVEYKVDMKNQTSSANWDVKYPLSKSIREAGLNTLLGLGTVFVVLIFLSFLIGQIHWIPDLIYGKKKEKEAAEKAAPAAVASAPAAEEAPEAEEEVDDLELVAVISAAIAAYEGTASTDGFVVRSIRKSRRGSRWSNS